MLIRPLFSFYGSKWRIAKQYPAPIHPVIVEPFAGSAGYSLRHYDRQVILIDKDPAVVGTWQFLLRSTSDDIMRLPDLEPGQSVSDLPVCQEAKWLIGWWTNKGTTHPCLKMSAWGKDGRYQNQFWGRKIKTRIAASLDLIRHWKIIEGDYLEYANREATWFIDPPYQKAGKHYVCGSDDIDYSRLSKWCKSRQGQVIVCENSGARWLQFQKFMDIKANESKTGGKVSEEAIWCKML